MTSPPLIGEPLALDLINTVFSDASGGQVDALATQEGLSAWIELEDCRLSRPAGRVHLDGVRDLRTRISTVVDHVRAGTRPPEGALAAVTSAQRSAPAYRKLAWHGDALEVRVARDGDATSVLLAELAEAATDLLSDPRITDVRRCAGAHCRLLFLPAHPRRQWCSPASCGNRARAARYYQRHKSTTD